MSSTSVPHAPSRGWAELALLGVALIWGHNVPLMKIALAELHPFGFNAVRLTLSALLLGALTQLEPAGTALSRSTWLRILAVGVLGSLLYQCVFIVGVNRTTAGNVGLIIASAPIWTTVLARVSGVEQIRASAWLGVAIAFAGTAWITLEGGAVDLGSDTLQGNLMILVSAICWALATVMSKRLVGEVSPTRLAYLTTVCVLAFHLVLGWPHLGPIWRLELSAAAWFAVAFSGLLSTGLAYSLWNLGIRQVGPSRTSVYTNLVPVITLCASVWMLGESVTLWQLTGGVLVLAGLVVMRRR